MLTKSLTKSQWKIYCETENDWVYGFSEDIPTKCYNNDSHTVTNDSSIKIEINTENIVVVKEENIKTGGHYRTKTFIMDIPAGITGTVTIQDESFPHPINMLNTFFNTYEEHHYDEFNIQVAPDTLVGIITEDIVPGITYCIRVNNTVFDNVNVGHSLTITNGVTSANIGCITENDNKGMISLDSIINETFSSGSHVSVTVDFIKSFHLEKNQRYILGNNKIGASYVGSNTVGRLMYTNNNGLAKKFIFGIEYLY